MPRKVLEDIVASSPVIKFWYETHSLEVEHSATRHIVFSLMIPKVPPGNKMT